MVRVQGTDFLLVPPDQRQCAMDDRVAEEESSTNLIAIWTAPATRLFIASAGNREVAASVVMAETSGVAEVVAVDGIWAESACTAT